MLGKERGVGFMKEKKAFEKGEKGLEAKILKENNQEKLSRSFPLT